MPGFNGSGTYSRTHNFATDKTNLVPVTASRVDTDLDGIATGLSSCLVKDGQQTATARIPFALGTSAMSGAVSGVSYAHTNDANTGLYFPAADQYGLAAGGTATITSTAALVTVPVNLAVTGTLAVTGQVTGVFASGTAMLFVQTAAPTGWTKSATHNNKALRVVSGAASSGGSTAFTSVFAARTITQGNLPNVNFTVTGGTGGISNDHTHPYEKFTDNSDGGVATGAAFSAQVAGNHSTVNTGGVSSDHSHTLSGCVAASGGSGTAMDFDVAYVDVIIALKD